MLKPLKTIIADDEYLICDTLAEILDALGLDVVEVCHDGLAVLEAIHEFSPDIVFLDIRMPGLSGIEVAERLAAEENPPLVVFISAYDDYGLKAYEVHAIDYILKPFVKEDIAGVIRKLERLFTKTVQLTQPAAEKRSAAVVYPFQFCAYRGNRTELIQAEEILYVHAENRGVFVTTLSGTVYSLRSRLSEVEEKLDPQYFFRCHRNYLVNMRQAKELAPGFNRGYLLILKGNGKIEVPVSRSRISQLARYVHY